MKVLAKFEWKKLSESNTFPVEVLKQGTATLYEDSSIPVMGTGHSIPSFVAEAVKFLYVHGHDVESVLKMNDYEISYVFKPKRNSK